MLSDRLKQLRIENNFLQKEIAQKLKITTSAYGFYEQGKRTPDAETLNKIAELYNVSIDYLLGRTNIRDSADKITKSLNDDPELTEFWDTLKDREDLKLLFKQTKEMTPGDIKKIIRIIKAIEDEEDRNDG
ncbi:helix-turn-helix domain-containing protein [Clostridium tyrobutyricum]|uniref:helix-turn-helix domain-containing protein n=1 Tax=Clostridium tyrobutyricum TaxID=1519 RepID=UPI001C3852D8|nr:helix-turn-helix transcriptional regulator [Clostridium tyrobutyricum]MBV4422789.1 helix-turn-helix domain-containing protein [Clostridium tyrobutyricum]MBV4432686.1 helix-turn-helix domain-containing protein [Clostridium tyrobutyricum]